MTCTVYCLVPRDGQVEPLVRRVQEAGVDIHDIAIVVRPTARAPATRPPAGSAQPPPELRGQGASLLSPLLWWPLWLYANNAQDWLQPGDDEATEFAVIPLADYLEKCP